MVLEVLKLLDHLTCNCDPEGRKKKEKTKGRQTDTHTKRHIHNYLFKHVGWRIMKSIGVNEEYREKEKKEEYKCLHEIIIN